MPPVGRRSTRFETTSWSLIMAASAAGGDAPPQALGDLCKRYWSPVHAFIRSRGYSPEEADDLTQSFFARIIEKNYLAQAEKSRGRFRNYLLGAVKHFLANEYDQRVALKRGGGQKHVFLDDDDVFLEPSGPMSPEQIFARTWALRVLEQVVGELRAEAAAADRSDEFERLLPFVGGEAPRQGYAALAAETGMTEGALRVAVHRQRLRFRDRLRKIIAETVIDEREVDDEIRFLIEAVSVRSNP